MKWEDYINKFEEVLSGENRNSPYDDIVYREYVKLNRSRVQRWLKKDNINDETKQIFSAIKKPQKWILITEPWCGDAAHSSPLIKQLADQSENIELEVTLRDDGSNFIDNYLTNGGKAIPKLVVKDENGNDLFTWGPRPKSCQKMVMDMKNTEISAQKKNMKIQQWYNENRGTDIQAEICRTIEALS